jgi:heme-degrading monooxygenase HmoA
MQRTAAAVLTIADRRANRLHRDLMICRIWHGWTTLANADAYERLLRTEIFHGIAGRAIDGYRGIELLRRERESDVEFVTLMWFDSLDAVRVFAGDAYETAVVPAAARALLSRFDARSAHYEVRVPREPAAGR